MYVQNSEPNTDELRLTIAAQSESRHWESRLLVAMMLGLAAAAVWAWASVFYLHLPLNELLSFLAKDRPYLPQAGYVPRPIFGVHFFGDLQECLSWAKNLIGHGTSPYTFPNIYPPLGIALFVPFAFLSPTAAVATFLILSMLFMSIPFVLILDRRTVSQRFLIVLICIVMSAPFAATIDRGNLQGLVVGVIALSFLAAARGRWNLFACLMGVAVAMKGYPALLLIIPLATGKFRQVLNALLWAAAITIVGFVALSGGPVHNVESFLDGLTGFSSTSLDQLNYSLIGMSRQIGGAMFGQRTSAAWFDEHAWINWLVLAAWLGMLIVVKLRSRVPGWCWLILCFSTLQVALPVSYPYTLTWAFLGVACFLESTAMSWVDSPSSGSASQEELSHRFLRWFSLVTLVATLTPLTFLYTVSSSTLNVKAIFSPALVLVLAIICLGLSVLPVRAKRNCGG